MVPCSYDRDIISEAVKWHGLGHCFITIARFNYDFRSPPSNLYSKLHKSSTLKAVKHRFLKSPNYLLPYVWFCAPTKKVTCSGRADCGWGSIPMPLTFISVMNWLSTGNQSMEFGGEGRVCVLAPGRPTGSLARQSFGNLLILSGPLWCHF